LKLIFEYREQKGLIFENEALKECSDSDNEDPHAGEPLQECTSRENVCCHTPEYSDKDSEKPEITHVNVENLDDKSEQ